MSHQTGIKANEKLKKFFSSYLDLNVRVFKVSIENEELTLSHFEKVVGSWKEDFDKLVPPLVLPAQPAYILYRLDTKNETTGYDWLLISWSPDESPVRQKMLFASTKATLKQEFGSGQIKEEYHATSVDEVSLKSLERHRLTVKSPAPLTTREEELVELRKSETTGLTEISVDSRSQTLSGVSFPLLPDALSAVQQLAKKEINYAQFKIDVSPKSSKVRSRSVPAFKTTIETDSNSNTIELKMTIPMPEQAQRSLSVACLIASSEEFFPPDDSSSFSYHEENAVSPDKKFHNLKSLCISCADPFVSSSGNSGFQDLCIDGTVNRNSDSNSEDSNILSNSDPVVAEVNDSSSTTHIFDFEEESSESSDSPIFKTTVKSNKRKPKEDVAYAPKNLKKPKGMTSPIKHDIKEASKRSVESNNTKSSSFSNMNVSISQLNKYIQQLPAENNNTDCEQTMLILESILKEILTLKGKNVSLPSRMHKALLTALSFFITTEALVDEKRKFVSKSVYPLITLSAESVFIILSSHSKEVPFDELTVSQMALFVFNNYFNSLLPVARKSNRKNDPLSELNFDKAFGKNSYRHLLNKFEEILSLFGKIPEIIKVSNDAFSKLASVCISSIFTPNILNLQHSCLTFITSCFTLFEEKRILILEHIISTVALLNSDSNFTAKSFVVSNSDTKIQFITAALLQFAYGTANYLKNAASVKSLKELYHIKSDETSNLFRNFFNKMIHNSVSNSNFKSVLENLIVDLLNIRFQPEWPVCNFILRYLQDRISCFFTSKSSNRHVQNVCLDYLSLILPVLRQDFVMRPSLLNALSKILPEQSQYGAFSKNTDLISIVNSDAVRCIKLVIQKLIDCKNSKSLRNLTQFFCILLIEEMLSNISKFKGDTSNVQSVSKQCDELFAFIYEIIKCLHDSGVFGANCKPILSNPKDEVLFKTICRYLSSSNSFACNSEQFLTHVIIRACDDTNPQLQLKAIKCMLSIVEKDTNLLCYSYVELAIKRAVTHRSMSIREKAIDFLSQHILTSEDIFEKYFDIVSGRILDVSVPVRKTALSILCEICRIKPDHSQISDTLVKILRRLNDEPQIVKVIIDFFKLKWIQKSINSDSDSILPIILEILSILKLAKDNDSISYFAKLFKSFVNSNDSELKKISSLAYRRIVECVLNQMLKDKMLDIDSSINCYRLLLMIISAKSEIAADLTPILYPHLCSELKSNENRVILNFVLQLFQQLFLWNQSYFQNDAKKSFFFSQFVELMNTANYKITIQSVCCFSLISRINNDFSRVVKIFVTYHELLKSFEGSILTNDTPVKEIDEKESTFSRILIVLAALIKYCNFSRIQIPNFDLSVVKKTAQTIVTLLINDSKNRSSILKAFLLISNRFTDAILLEKVVSVFSSILQHPDNSIQLKIQVLEIVNCYLQEDNLRSKVLNDNWSKISKREDLKKMNDVSAGKPSIVAQRYLPCILECYLVRDKNLRITAAETLMTITNHSLLHPTNFLHYSVCMLADLEPSIANAAFKTLTDLQVANASLIRPSCLKGILLSVELLQITSSDEVLRGFILVGNNPSSRFSKLYELLELKDKNSIVSSMINEFEASFICKVKLNGLLYLADNLAYFPYKEVHNLLNVLYKISTIICNSAVPLFQKIQDALIENCNVKQVAIDENNNEPMSRMEKSQRKNADCAISQLSSSCETGFAYILLLQLWHFLKSYYHISDKYLRQHMMENASRIKKPVTRNLKLESFNPESVIHYLKSGFSDPSHNKENLTGTPLIGTLKSLSAEFKELSAKLIAENLDDL